MNKQISLNKSSRTMGRSKLILSSALLQLYTGTQQSQGFASALTFGARDSYIASQIDEGLGFAQAGA